MRGKCYWFETDIPAIKVLHYHYSSRVQVSKPEKHSSLWFRFRIADVSRIGAILTVRVVNITHDFNLEVGLCRGCLNIRRLALVVPQEYFSPLVPSEVIVVRTKETSWLGVLQAHDTRAGNNALVVFICPSSEKSDGEFVPVCTGVYFMKCGEFIGEHATVNLFCDYGLVIWALFLDLLLWAQIWNRNFAVRDVQELSCLDVAENNDVAVINTLTVVTILVAWLYNKNGKLGALGS